MADCIADCIRPAIRHATEGFAEVTSDGGHEARQLGFREQNRFRSITRTSSRRTLGDPQLDVVTVG
jgi:hypothetical protein